MKIPEFFKIRQKSQFRNLEKGFFEVRRATMIKPRTKRYQSQLMIFISNKNDDHSNLYEKKKFHMLNLEINFKFPLSEIAIRLTKLV